MGNISISTLKKMTVTEIKAAMPFKITADGDDVAVVAKEQIAALVPVPTPVKVVGKIQCPNCKLTFDAAKQNEIQPFFFSTKHPKG